MAKQQANNSNLIIASERFYTLKQKMATFTRRAALQILAAYDSPLFAAPHPPSKKMYLSLNETLVTGRVKWPDFAQLAARVGFPGVDVMLRPAMDAGADATNTLMSQLHIRPAVIGFPVEFNKDDAAFQTSLAKLEPASRFAQAIGCPRMVTYIMPSSRTPKPELRALYKKRFSECSRIMAPYNVRLGLEFLGPQHFRKQFPHEFIWRMPEMLEFAKECGPNIGLLLDAWHWHHAGATIDDILAAGRDRIVHVHFDDAPNLPPEQIRDNERLMPGEGVINLVGFLQALKTIGYTDALSVEVFGRGLKTMTPEEGAKLGLEKAQAVFAKAGI
jgi:sugar phosphate isomerase/epimerase